jgi:hypothetical protein
VDGREPHDGHGMHALSASLQRETWSSRMEREEHTPHCVGMMWSKSDCLIWGGSVDEWMSHRSAQQGKQSALGGQVASSVQGSSRECPRSAALPPQFLLQAMHGGLIATQDAQVDKLSARDTAAHQLGGVLEAGPGTPNAAGGP